MPLKRSRISAENVVKNQIPAMMNSMTAVTRARTTPSQVRIGRLDY